MKQQVGTLWRLLILIVLLAGTAMFLHSRGQAEVLPPREPLDALPLQIQDWKGTVIPIPQWALDVLGAGEFVEHNYSRAPKEPSVDLFLAYFPSQRMGSTMHSPQNCLPGAGWTPIDTSRVDLNRPGGGTIRVNRYILSKGLDKLLVLYWYQAHGRVVSSEYWSKFYLVADAIEMNRSDGALVRVMTPIWGGESPAIADQRSTAFIQAVLPVLDKYIPK
jgi:EpsI family protein